MSYRKRRSPTKGKRCVRYRRVRVRGQGMARRCVKYAGRSAGRSRKKKRRGGFRRGSRPFNKGKKCVAWGRDRRGRRTCRSYGKVYGGKYKNRRRSSPDIVHEQRTYENRMRRMMYDDTDQNVPSWWAT